RGGTGRGGMSTAQARARRGGRGRRKLGDGTDSDEHRHSLQAPMVEYRRPGEDYGDIAAVIAHAPALDQTRPGRTSRDLSRPGPTRSDRAQPGTIGTARSDRAQPGTAGTPRSGRARPGALRGQAARVAYRFTSGEATSTAAITST